MKQNYEYEKICLYCSKSTFIEDSEACVCKLYGAVHADGYCRKFKLDLLKLNPSKAVVYVHNDDLIF
ncbi:MAG: hypothetical protein RR246_03080 [Clostridia bacterium]